MNGKRVLIKVATALATSAAFATAFIGVAHTPWGRPLLELPLLRAMASHAGCPLGHIEPDAFERVRTLKLRAEVGGHEAGAHPALGFVLGRTLRKNVESWANDEHVSCKPGHVSSVLECENVIMAGDPRIASLRLQFDAQQRLVAVDLFRSAATPAELVARFETWAHELDERVGPATSAVGTPSVTFVNGGPLRTVTRTYGYRDYVATAMLLNFGKRGVRLREQYQWLGSEPPA